MIKNILLLALFIVLFLALPVLTSGQQVNAQSGPIPYDREADQALCLPDETATPNSTDCLLSGPAERIKGFSKIGITFPPAPLPVITIPYELNTIPYTYAKLKTTEAIPLFASLDAARTNTSTTTLGAGKTRYLSLLYKESTEQGTFYQISTGEWVSSDAIQKVGVQDFRGFLFKENPEVSFGWVLTESSSRKAPGYAADETGKKYARLNIIRVFDTEMANDVEWLMIGPDEWIEHRYVSRIIPNYTKPAGVESDRWIEVNLYEQVLLVYEKDRLVFATLISSGVDPFFTQPGVFKIYKRLTNDPMSGAFEADKSDYYYLQDVPFIMYYDQARALHGAYWNTLFGYQRSHGCVNLSVADAHWVFDWSQDGDFVYVWDPSGKTPTDPSFYGAGGF